MALVTEYLLTPCESNLIEALRWQQDPQQLKRKSLCSYEQHPIQFTGNEAFCPNISLFTLSSLNPYHSTVMIYKPELPLCLPRAGKCFSTQVKFKSEKPARMIILIALIGREEQPIGSAKVRVGGSNGTTTLQQRFSFVQSHFSFLMIGWKHLRH